MNILQILTVWLACVVILSFVKLKWGICFYLVYSILVPYVELGIPGLGRGHIMVLMAFSYFIHYHKYLKNLNIKPIIPFLTYFIVSLLIIPFQNETPWDYMMTWWRRDVLGTLFLPTILWNVMRIDNSAIVLFRNTLLFCIIIAIGYGLFQTTLGGFNPYILAFSQYMVLDVDIQAYYTEETGRVFGRISSVFYHPMSFALFIGLFLIYLFYIRKELGNCISYIFLAATTVMALVCGVRSVLGGLFLTGIYYLIMKRSFKIVFYVILAGLVGIVILSFLPSLSDYLSSIKQPGNIRGSSLEMRLEQLGGAIDEAEKNPLFGLGYNWTDYYNSKNGDHPICITFESLVFVIICNSGLVGIFLWSYLILKSFVTNARMKVRDVYIVNALMVFYIFYSVITGEYGYMKYYLLFYILMIGESLPFDYKKANKHKIKNCQNE